MFAVHSVRARETKNAANTGLPLSSFSSTPPTENNNNSIPTGRASIRNTKNDAGQLLFFVLHSPIIIILSGDCRERACNSVCSIDLFLVAELVKGFFLIVTSVRAAQMLWLCGGKSCLLGKCAWLAQIHALCLWGLFVMHAVLLALTGIIPRSPAGLLFYQSSKFSQTGKQDRSD